jgi:putative transposase
VLTDEGYRRRIRHYEGRQRPHELTFSCIQKLPLLGGDDAKRIVGRAVSVAIHRHDFDLLAFVLMPTHVHLVVLPRAPKYSIAKLLFAIKRPSSYRLKRLMAESVWYPKLISDDGFRYWQPGPGYDRNLTSAEAARNSIQYLHMNPVRAGICATPAGYQWSSWTQWHRPEQPIAPDVPPITRLRIAGA